MNGVIDRNGGRLTGKLIPAGNEDFLKDQYLWWISTNNINKNRNLTWPRANTPFWKQTTSIHGAVYGYGLTEPEYELFVLPHDTIVKSEIHAGTIQLSSNSGIARSLIALFQIVFATYTLFRTSHSQIEAQGYSAFYFTVIPYLVMSGLNFIGSLVTPIYPSMYMVKSDISDEAERRGWKFESTVGRVDPVITFCPKAGPKQWFEFVSGLGDQSIEARQKLLYLRPLGNTLSASPCVDQVQRTSSSKNELLIELIEVNRDYEHPVQPDNNETTQLALIHTGDELLDAVHPTEEHYVKVPRVIVEYEFCTRFRRQSDILPSDSAMQGDPRSYTATTEISIENPQGLADGHHPGAALPSTNSDIPLLSIEGTGVPALRAHDGQRLAEAAKPATGLGIYARPSTSQAYIMRARISQIVIYDLVGLLHLLISHLLILGTISRFKLGNQANGMAQFLFMSWLVISVLLGLVFVFFNFKWMYIASYSCVICGLEDILLALIIVLPITGLIYACVEFGNWGDCSWIK